MPDVRETFDVATRSVRPAPGALERQHRRQRRRRAGHRAAAFAVAAGVVAVAIVLAHAWSRPTGTPASPGMTPPTSQPPPALFAVDPATGAATRVVGNVSAAYRATVSPDGSRVAFVRTSKGHPQLFVTDGAGGPTRLTGPDKGGCGCGAFDPAWSRDGTAIAFASVDLYGNQDIYVLKLRTGSIRRITHGPSLDATPAWSPDGSMIAYARGDDGRAGLWVVDLADRRSRLVTATTGGADPAWSPDGQMIAFSGSAAGGAGTDLWLVRPDGTGLRDLADGAPGDRAPSWSPDGTRIVFAAFRSDASPPTTEIDVVDVATGRISVLASGFDDPVWSADGGSILALRA